MAEVEESLMLRMLNDDCIFKILEWLPMSDIRSYSEVCKRLQALCNNHAQRKLHDETVEIVVSSKGYLKLRSKNKNVKFFNNFIKRLRIRGEFDISKWPEQDLLASFVKTKCNQNCTYEMVVSSGFKLYPFLEEIDSVLNNLETVYVKNATQHGDVSNFFKYCPNLTTLFVCRVLDEMLDAILRQKYPKLKRVHLHLHCGKSQLDPEVLKTFLLENDQIQCLELGDSIYPFDENGWATLKSIETVVNFASNLEHFFLQIDTELEGHFEQICGYLKNLCDRSNFKYLELRVDVKQLMQHSNRLTNFKQLKKIHIRPDFEVIDQIDGDFSSVLGPFVQLKSIVIDLTPWYRRNDRRIILPPQIEELTLLDERRTNCEAAILSYSMLCISQCKNLKKLSVFKAPGKKPSVTFPVAQMNEAREKLNHAVSVTIFTNFHGSKTNSDHKLVKLRYVSIVGLRA